MQSRSLAAGIAAACLSAGAAAGPAADSLDDIVRTAMKSNHIPGVSVAVVQNGNVVLARGWGLANVEWAAAASDTSVYELLSLGKQFVAAAVMHLAADGTLELDGTLGDYLPESPAAWRKVTVRQLLSHTAGIPEYTKAPDFWKSVRLETSPQEVVASVAAKPLDFEPGTRWSYSNTGYFLLGLIVEKVAGKPLPQFLSQQVFDPLGMTSTRMNDLAAVIPHRAAGYAWTRDGLRNEEYVSPSRKWAAGAVVSDARDLARWECAIASGRLLDAATWREMEAPVRLADGSEAHYGLGNELDRDHGHRVAGHQGGALGFDATILRYPDDGLSVIVLANLRGAETRKLARRVATMYLPALSDAGNAGIDDPDPALTERLKLVFASAARGEVDEALFSSRGKTETVPMIRSAGPHFLGPLGTLQSLVLLETTAHDGGRTLRYRASYASRSIVWTIDVDGEGKISSMEPQPE